MTFDQFIASLAQSTPPENLSPSLTALWLDGQGKWHDAHDVAQEVHSPDGAWVHAYLHRKEGDNANASYWYRQARKPFPSSDLATEWKDITRTLLSSQA